MLTARSRGRQRGRPPTSGESTTPGQRPLSCSTPPTEAAIERCAQVIAAGGVAVVPTDTLYGLAAGISNAEAVARVAAIKGRALGTGMPVLLASSEQVASVGVSAPYLEELGAAFWPGGVTLVIPARPAIDPRITDTRRTVAVRVPGMAVTREICRRAGAPITGTSANRHGDPPPTSAAEARAALGDAVDALLDGGPVGGTASTIVDLTGDRPRILRAGAVSWDDLRRIAPTIVDAASGP
ncbi:MAG: L-threonylcarbamoyladenylate synthase [Chloroflexi bacterium]|nr:L-threonylcarbamoyladenylate synthase [Chloroflexota bacterium]